MSTTDPDAPHTTYRHPSGFQSRPASSNPPSPAATTLSCPFLRTAAILSFIPALPLCITHGVLSNKVVPALGLVPLFFSAVVSLLLLLAERRRTGSGKGKQPHRSEVDVEGGLEDDPGEGGSEAEANGTKSGSVWTHRILVFIVDLALAAALMVVLVFTWIGVAAEGRGQRGPPRADLAMLAAYCTIPLLVNFLIHLSLALREFSAGLALPGLVEYAAWRAVPADCPHCGHRLRPDSLPPIPWYETVSRPRLPAVRRPPPLLGFTSVRSKLPGLSALRPKRDWNITVPRWMRGRRGEEEPARLFVDNEQDDHEPYTDDSDDGLTAARSTTTAVATGSVRGGPVEEVVVGKKAKGRSGADVFGDEEASWS
ncbi:hypothetical protein VTJ83DRAFT_3776 [Remersonia thermophila]|uniref:Uncharacterized protein n=1 Tax=Remersonia thermophila TaxID=72144 RepID=A0ABR4DF42_9PEZI